MSGGGLLDVWTQTQVLVSLDEMRAWREGDEGGRGCMKRGGFLPPIPFIQSPPRHYMTKTTG